MRVIGVVLGLSVLVLWHELGHAFVSKLFRLYWTDFSFGFGPTVASKTWRGVRWRLGLIPFGGFVRVAQLSLRADEINRFQLKPTLARILVLLAGSGANFLLASMLITCTCLFWGQSTNTIEGLEITKVSGHAASCGLKTGDLIQKINQTEIQSVEDVQKSLSNVDLAHVELKRGHEQIHLGVPPIAKGNRVGFDARYVVVMKMEKPSVIRALEIGAVFPLHQSGVLLKNSKAMLAPKSKVRPLTPLGLASRVSQTGRWRVRRVLESFAQLSVLVGLFNLLPIPGLDGGRLLLEGVETLRKKRIPIRWALHVQVMGALALLILWLVLGWSDVMAFR